MALFLHAHATHPDWRMALAIAAAQLDSQRHEAAAGGAPTPTLGWIYLTDHYAAHADALLAELKRRWPDVAWVGSVGIGVCASGVEYFDEPALALMQAPLPRDRFALFSGTQPLAGFAAHTALVHADGSTPDLSELIAEMSGRTASGYLFGGLASARTSVLHIADEVFKGGLSGVAFAAGVTLVSRVTQGCQPVGPTRRVTRSQRNVVVQLDDRPALDCLLEDLHVNADAPREALPAMRQTLVGLIDAPPPGPRALSNSTLRPGAFGPEVRVRHLVGIDPQRRGIAIADDAPEGIELAFCQRHTEAARRDLVRICTEIREALEPEEWQPRVATGNKPLPAAGGETAAHGAAARIAGAIYVSCTGRGGPHFGAPSAELAIVRHALGDVPLVGFFAAGEIAHHHLYGYTGVLTVFAE